MSVPKEWTDTWNLFDEKKAGTVSKIDFKHIVRSLGRKYTESDLNEAMKSLSDPVSYKEFVTFMQQPYSGPTEDDLKMALRAFDGGDTGMLKLSELVTLLTTLGEKMPESEVRQLLAEVATDSEGRVSIEELTKYLCTPVPSMTPDIAELQRQLAQQ